MSEDQAPARPFNGIPKHPKEIRDKAFRLFVEGKHPNDISYELQIPVGTLYNWMRRDKWEIRKTAEQAGVDAETSVRVAKQLAKTTKPTEPTNLTLTEKQERYQELMGDAAVRLADHVATLEGPQLVAAADKLLKADQIARKALKLETEKPSTVIQIGVLAQPTNQKSIKQASVETLTLAD